VRRGRIDPRRVKLHFPYTVEEAARALGVHANTVRHWLRDGLAVADDKRPVILNGEAIREFLNARSRRRKQPLSPGQFYCLPCRRAVSPDGDMADLVPDGTGLGTLTGLCPGCGRLVHRRVSMETWRKAAAALDVTIRPEMKRPPADRPGQRGKGGPSPTKTLRGRGVGKNRAPDRRS